MKEAYLIENDIIEIKPSRIYIIINSFVKYLYILILLIPISIVTGFFKLNINAVAWVVAAVYFCYSFFKFLSFSSIQYYITPERLIVERGIFGKSTYYLEFYNIVQYVKKQSFLLRIFGIFSLYLYSDENEVFFELKGLDKRRENLPAILRELVQNAKMKYRFTYYR